MNKFGNLKIDGSEHIVLSSDTNKLLWVSSKLVNFRSLTLPIYPSPIWRTNLTFNFVTLPIYPQFNCQLTSFGSWISNLTFNLTSSISPLEFQWFQSVFLPDKNNSLDAKDCHATCKKLIKLASSYVFSQTQHYICTVIIFPTSPSLRSLEHKLWLSNGKMCTNDGV